MTKLAPVREIRKSSPGAAMPPAFTAADAVPESVMGPCPVGGVPNEYPLTEWLTGVESPGPRERRNSGAALTVIRGGVTYTRACLGSHSQAA